MTTDTDAPPPDRLTETIGVLTRREAEARILGPVISALVDRLGAEAVIPVVRDTIVALAREQGAALAERHGNDSAAFADTLQYWTRGDALEIDVLEQDADRFHFNVTRCRYAELYRALGLEDLGAVLSCNRDNALIEGFNPDARLTRTQTILGGAPFCDFRYDFSGSERP